MAGLTAHAETSLDDILAKNHSAVFGQSEHAELASIDIDLTITESGHELTAWYRATADGRMRIDVFSGTDRVFSEGLDERGAWEWPVSQPAPSAVDHEGVGALEHGIEFNLYSLAELRDRGHTVEWLGKETLLTVEYDVLKITLQDGFETFRFTNAETGRVDASRDFRAFHPGIDATRQQLETRYDRWQQTDGIVRATRSRTFELATEELIATATVTRVAYNIAPARLHLTREFVPDGPPDSGPAHGAQD